MIRQADAARNLPRVIVLHMHDGPMKNCSYLVFDPSSLRAVIVDPAWEIEKIERAVADTEALLSDVLVTHSHPDHIHPANVEREYLSAVFQSRVLRGFSLEKEAGQGKAVQFSLRACARGKKHTIGGKT